MRGVFGVLLAIGLFSLVAAGCGKPQPPSNAEIDQAIRASLQSDLKDFQLQTINVESVVPVGTDFFVTAGYTLTRPASNIHGDQTQKKKDLFVLHQKNGQWAVKSRQKFSE
ncbi:MAG: hypothetical protein H6684_16425 [Deltaproteobacteria bacterium]|nr:hypothetical protein [bacterium]MCB9475762.1 hypothetical protein [Deltaproteobacteria bacterium]MCB9490319.1 hypothetical protein [Deltaproteobacteria bacterium]